MKPFKIDTMYCTKEEREEMQKRWFKIGWKWLSGRVPNYLNKRFFYGDESNELSYDGDSVSALAYFHKCDYEELSPDEFLTPREPEIDLSEYDTIDIDYTGCDSVVAAALKQSKAIRCRVGGGEVENIIIQFDSNEVYPYKTITNQCYDEVEPIKRTRKPYIISLGSKLEETSVKTMYDRYEITEETMRKIKEIVEHEN